MESHEQEKPRKKGNLGNPGNQVLQQKLRAL
jgi:hypothetical protein